MRLRIGMALLSLAIIGLAGCSRVSGTAQPAADATADEATIRAATLAWNTAYNTGDVDRIVAMYTDDAVVMPPYVPSLVGHAALREFLTKDMAAAKAAGLTSKDGVSAVGIAGDLAWHAGTSSVVDAAGKTVETGSYVEVWRRVNSRWLMVRDIWNDDAPPAAPQT